MYPRPMTVATSLDFMAASFSLRSIRHSPSIGQALWRMLMFVLLLPSLLVWSLVRAAVLPAP